MTAESIDQLAEAMAAVGRLVADVRDEQWELPTPCDDWNVRQLVNHLVGGDGLFTAVLSGAEPPSPADLERRRGLDQLGADPTSAYRAGSAALIAAFRQPGLMERTVTVPFGAVPGGVALHLRTAETLVHGWDLAQAIGRPVEFPAGLAEQELAFTLATLGGIPPERTPFGPPQPAPEAAPALDRLAALLGRQVGGRDIGGREVPASLRRD